MATKSTRTSTSRTNVQAWVAVASVVISTLSLGLATLAFWDQRAAATRVIRAGSTETLRVQQRYASRLTWRDASWSPDRGLLRIQNRSISTRNSVVVIGHSGGLALVPGDIAPCSGLIINVLKIFGSNSFGEPAWTTEAIVFRDPVGAWLLDKSGLHEFSDGRLLPLVIFASGMRAGVLSVVELGEARQIQRITTLVAPFVAAEPVAECGEG